MSIQFQTNVLVIGLIPHCGRVSSPHMCIYCREGLKLEAIYFSERQFTLGFGCLIYLRGHCEFTSTPPRTLQVLLGASYILEPLPFNTYASKYMRC